MVGIVCREQLRKIDSRPFLLSFEKKIGAEVWVEEALSYIEDLFS